MNPAENDFPSNSLKSILLWATVILLIAIGFGGTVVHGWWREPVWSSEPAGNAFYIYAAGSLIIYVAALRTRIRFWVPLIPALAVYTGMAGIGPLATVMWFWCCATLVGAWLLVLMRCPGVRFSVRSSVVGLAVLGSLTGLSAHFPVCTPIFFFSLFSILAILSAWRLRVDFTFRFRADMLLVRTRRGWPDIFLGALLLFGVASILLIALMPEVGHDALAMHLNISARMLREGRWIFNVNDYVWAVMPFGADWFFVPPYFLAGEPAARLMNASLLLATAAMMHGILVRRAGALVALAGPAILLTLPLSFLVTGSVFVEPALALFFLASLAELMFQDSREKGSWIVLGIIAGYACSIKLLGVPLLPFLLVGACMRSRTGQFEAASLRGVGFGVLAFAVFSLPPYIVAFWKTGNPLFPFYNEIFKSPLFTTLSVFGNAKGFANVLYTKPLSLELFWDASIDSRGFGEFVADGAIGIALLVMVPFTVVAALLRRRWALLALLLATLCYAALVFNSQAYLRYIYQVIPWLLVAGALALQQLPARSFLVPLVVIALCLVSIARFPVAYWPLQQFDPMLFVDRDTNRAFLDRSQPIVAVGDILDRMEGMRDQQILIIGPNGAFSHFPRGTIADSWHSLRYFYSQVKYTQFTPLISSLGVDVIVHSLGADEPHEAEIIRDTDELFRFHSIRVGTLKPSLVYTHERIADTDLRQPGPAWHLNGARPSDGGVEATVDTPVTQLVEFRNFPRGLLEMQVACATGGQFRTQINWLDAKGSFIGTDIALHQCEPQGVTVSRKVPRPDLAAMAQVFGGSHDARPVTIRKISLRTAF